MSRKKLVEAMQVHMFETAVLYSEIYQCMSEKKKKDLAAMRRDWSRYYITGAVHMSYSQVMKVYRDMQSKMAITGVDDPTKIAMEVLLETRK